MPMNLATAAVALAVTAAVAGGAQSCDVPSGSPGAIDWPAAPKPAAVQQQPGNGPAMSDEELVRRVTPDTHTVVCPDGSSYETGGAAYGYAVPPERGCR